MAGMVARIHQGRFDSETELINLLNNAKKKENIEIRNAVEQRLKKVFPKLYQRLIGPVHQRNRDARFCCYCNYPKSLEEVCEDILSDAVPIDALMCDDCWQIEISSTWGYYGFSGNTINKTIWKALNEERARYKYVE